LQMHSSSVIFCVVLCVALASAHSISLSRKENKFIKNEDLSFSKRAALIASGTTITLDGGLLVLGTYIAPLKVGTPAITVEMLIDTGSANTAIPVLGCPTCGSNISNYFDPSASSTFKSMTCSSAACQTCTPTSSSCTDCSDFFGNSYCSSSSPQNCGFGITYGGGGTALQGYYGYDQACFGSLCTNVTLSLIENEYPPSNMDTGESTGILGLASEFNACNPTCVPPILDEYVGAGLTTNLFSICLNPSSGGVLDIGSINSARYTGSLQYAPMTLDRWYNIALLDIQIGGFSIGIPPFIYATTNDVIGTFVDSGTSVILMNSVSFESFSDTFIQHFSSLPGVSRDGFFGSPACILKSKIGQISSYPNVTFVVQSHDASSPISLPVPPSSYLIPSDGLYCLGIGGIPSVGVVLGDVFMENYYVVHDRVNQQVGFAPVNAQNCN